MSAWFESRAAPHRGSAMSELTAAVVVSSTSVAAGRAEDRTGPVIAGWATRRGWTAVGPIVVPDGEGVGAAITTAVSAGAALVVTTGGTGLTPDDVTPEQTAALIDRPAPGIAEAIRARGLEKTPFAALSRGVAGVIGHTLVVNLPGSLGAVMDGLAVLDEVIDHALGQLGHGVRGHGPGAAT